MYQRASAILTDPKAAQFVWGIGYHWYEPWSGGEPMFDNVRLVHETFPDKQLIFTEGCVDAFDPQKIGEWKFGEQYARSMIQDFNSGSVGWTDWNILLDERGGPIHVDNFCFAPVHANTKTGALLTSARTTTLAIFRRKVSYYLWIEGNAAEVSSLPHSIQTLVF